MTRAITWNKPTHAQNSLEGMTLNYSWMLPWNRGMTFWGSRPIWIHHSSYDNYRTQRLAHGSSLLQEILKTHWCHTIISIGRLVPSMALVNHSRFSLRCLNTMPESMATALIVQRVGGRTKITLAYIFFQLWRYVEGSYVKHMRNCFISWLFTDEQRSFMYQNKDFIFRREKERYRYCLL